MLVGLLRINRVVYRDEPDTVALDIHSTFEAFEIIEHIAVGDLPFVFHKPDGFGIFFQRLLYPLTQLVFQPDQVHDVPVLPIEEVVTSYYLRMRVDDKPGVLADITRILADSSISIEALLQKEAAEGESQTDIIMLTHRTVEKNANAAIFRIEALPVVQGKVTKLRMESL